VLLTQSFRDPFSQSINSQLDAFTSSLQTSSLVDLLPVLLYICRQHLCCTGSDFQAAVSNVEADSNVQVRLGPSFEMTLASACNRCAFAVDDLGGRSIRGFAF
jgi:hypothetical protein